MISSLGREITFRTNVSSDPDLSEALTLAAHGFEDARHTAE
jgi:hypothetical protein